MDFDTTRYLQGVRSESLLPMEIRYIFLVESRARGLEMDIGTACMVSASNLVILPMLAPDLVDQPVQLICDTFFGARPVQRPVR